MRTELHVPSDLRFLSIVEHWLLGSLKAELGNSVDWPRQESRLRLVLVEAYSNIVRHAHQNQPNLPVLMRLELSGRDILIELWDCGKGYDLSTYLPPNPGDLQENGYGWLILNRLMDKVEYRLQVNGRNCLTLEASLPPHEFRDVYIEDYSVLNENYQDQFLHENGSSHIALCDPDETTETGLERDADTFGDRHSP
ncbi:MAG: anti-sigma regulatory factor [Elainellaceae cyanobacterium]